LLTSNACCSLTEGQSPGFAHIVITAATAGSEQAGRQGKREETGVHLG